MLYEIYKLLEKPYAARYGVFIQNLILFNILVNLFIVFISTFFHLNDHILKVFNIVENFTVILFIIELVLRYITIGYDNKYSGIYGRLKFTFTFYTIVDIIAILPYFLTGMQTNMFFIRLLRFARLLKLIRMKKILKNFFSISTFATSNIIIQTFVLFILSIFFIYIFHFFYNGHNTSLMIFLDPPALAETKNNFELLFGIIELMVGLFIGGALISIITETLANITNAIHSGYYPFKEKNHIIIINYNEKLTFILYEMNQYYKNLDEVKSVVLYLPAIENISKFIKNQKKYSNLEISIITGEELNWKSYERININEADSLILLADQKIKIHYQHIKILKYIFSNSHFKNNTLRFIIEHENTSLDYAIYDELFSNKTNKYFLVNHIQIVENFLNRSVINPDYFHIFSNLLSFHGYEFYTIKAVEIFSTPIHFSDAFMKLSQGVLLGIVKDNNTILLNPPLNIVIKKNDKLILLLENRYSYEIDKTSKTFKKIVKKLPAASLKERKNICIVGDYAEINEDNIIQFLDDYSVQNIQKIVQSNNDYMQTCLWDEIIQNKFDVIILNLEDDYEFILTLYLRNKYKQEYQFINSLINIMHNPTNAMLLQDNTLDSNIILSEKIVGQYMAQILFNDDIIEIFDELTQSKGNEFYIFDKKNNKTFFEMEYMETKYTLLQNKMLYIGVFKNGTFILNYKDIKSSTKIVVLCIGTE